MRTALMLLGAAAALLAGTITGARRRSAEATQLNALAAALFSLAGLIG